MTVIWIIYFVLQLYVQQFKLNFILPAICSPSSWLRKTSLKPDNDQCKYCKLLQQFYHQCISSHISNFVCTYKINKMLIYIKLISDIIVTLKTLNLNFLIVPFSSLRFQWHTKYRNTDPSSNCLSPQFNANEDSGFFSILYLIL